MKFETMEDIEKFVRQTFPLGKLYEDVEGELIVYTGLANDGPNGIRPLSET